MKENRELMDKLASRTSASTNNPLHSQDTNILGSTNSSQNINDNSNVTVSVTQSCMCLHYKWQQKPWPQWSTALFVDSQQCEGSLRQNAGVDEKQSDGWSLVGVVSGCGLQHWDSLPWKKTPSPLLPAPWLLPQHRQCQFCLRLSTIKDGTNLHSPADAPTPSPFPSHLCSTPPPILKQEHLHPPHPTLIIWLHILCSYLQHPHNTY